MPFFVKVGFEEENQCKTTSKGYFIRRTGSWIITKWGAIDVISLKRKNFYWKGNYPQEKIYKLRTVQNAKDFSYWKIEYLISRGYNKLAPGKKIYKNNG